MAAASHQQAKAYTEETASEVEAEARTSGRSHTEEDPHREEEEEGQDWSSSYPDPYVLYVDWRWGNQEVEG